MGIEEVRNENSTRRESAVGVYGVIQGSSSKSTGEIEMP